MAMKSLEGQKALSFSLEGNDGKTHSLEDYRGQRVVLFFYPKDSTPG
jgi:thioredoxin-dependent peroxiredoxin